MPEISSTLASKIIRVSLCLGITRMASRTFLMRGVMASSSMGMII